MWSLDVGRVCLSPLPEQCPSYRRGGIALWTAVLQVLGYLSPALGGNRKGRHAAQGASLPAVPPHTVAEDPAPSPAADGSRSCVPELAVDKSLSCSQFPLKFLKEHRTFSQAPICRGIFLFLFFIFKCPLTFTDYAQ